MYYSSNDAINQAGMAATRNGQEMEISMFHKARSREEYVSLIAKLILHIRGMSNFNI